MIAGIEIKQIELSVPTIIVGKEFMGSYKDSPSYIDEVKSKLKSLNYYYKPFHAVSIYLSDPQTEKEDELKSFHGHVVFERRAVELPYEVKEMGRGKYLVSTTKDKSFINILYVEAFKYAAKNEVKLSNSEPPIVITTADDLGHPIFSIYFKVNE